mgnify:FL=1
MFPNFSYLLKVLWIFSVALLIFFFVRLIVIDKWDKTSSIISIILSSLGIIFSVRILVLKLKERNHKSENS